MDRPFTSFPLPYHHARSLGFAAPALEPPATNMRFYSINLGLFLCLALAILPATTRAQFVLKDGQDGPDDTWELTGEPPIGFESDPTLGFGMGPGLSPAMAPNGYVDAPVPMSFRDRMCCGIADCRAKKWTDYRDHFYFGYERIHFWTRGMQVPALVTTSPAGTPLSDAGVLGLPTTTVLFGNERFPTEGEIGRRFTLGMNVGPSGLNRIETQYFQIDHVTAARSAVTPDRYSILARPYVDATTGAQAASVIGYPGVVEGRVDLYTQADLRGWGVWGFHGIPVCGCPTGLQRIDLIAGYRNLDFDDRITVHEQLVSIDPTGSLPAGSTVMVQDEFRTENEFHGMDLGVAWRLDFKKWSFLPTVKVALGNLHQEVVVEGVTRTVTPTGTTTTYPAGLLALESNSGFDEHNEFVFVPEVNMNLYYHCSARKRVFVGYTMMMIPKVLRAGGLIDTALDPGQIPPSATTGLSRPAPVVRTDEFWAQGIHFGCEWDF